MNTNNFSTTILFSHDKPVIVNGQFVKFETLLFLPSNQDRIAEGGLRKKGNFKHSYKYIVNNDCLSANRNSSFEASEGKNKSTAGVLYSSVTATAYDNTDYAESKKNKIDLNCKTDTGKWYICDTDGNPVKPASMEIQEKIEGYIKSVQDNINCDLENTDKNEDALQRPITFLPLITVITVVFNGVKTLEETIKSVINQTYPNVEYIIIDGVSTDGTLDIIKKYEDAIDYWVSEPDKGIYDAMNKGVILAMGDIIGIINSDDWYVEGVFCEIFRNLNNDHEDVCLYYGDIFIIDKNGRKSYSMKSPDIDNIKDRLLINHQTCFIKNSAYKMYGIYNDNFRVAADYELLYRLFTNGIKFKYIPKQIANYRLGGFGEENFIKIGGKEYIIIDIKYGSNPLKAYLIGYFWILRKIIKKIFVLQEDSIIIKLYRKFFDKRFENLQ
jgi:glycosyltransferase involved in cell wall biosynthesis